MNPTHFFRPCGLLTALNADWDRLVETETPWVWRHRSLALAGCSDLDVVLARIRERPDPILGSLIALCADGDQLAGRTVLQAMLGKLVRFATCDVDAGLDDYVTAMWLRIRTYPLADRPVRIAPNLALDTLRAVKSQLRLPAGIDVTPYPPEAFVELLLEADLPPDGEPGAGSVIETAARCGLINQDTRAVLTSVYVDGLTGVAAGERHGKSAAAIRVQCHKAVRRLALHRTTLVQAA